ncbi:hypothetical protein [Microbulbifer sp. SAOS-129_SWC]|uniref:hypothetical protein n=1 Tax=Microbulbifer sp. SAOS-129_SWC TaxID=3145235 RepID=UPI0032169868
MKNIITAIAIFVFASFSVNLYAGQATQAFGICLTDSLTGKERKTLAKWIFFAIAAHPEIKSYAKMTDKDQDQANRFVGNLVTRLITEDCPNQAKRALKEDGGQAFEQAFGLVGKVAMRELMADKHVVQSVSGFEKYLDKDKFIALKD